MKPNFTEVDPKQAIRIGVCLVVAGILISGWKLNRIAEEVSSLAWEEANGTVVSADFDSKVRYVDGKTTTIYFAALEYRYTVGGKEYTGNRYDASGDLHTGLKNKAKMLEEKLKVGAPVTVFYDKSSPSDSVLKNGISEDTGVRFAFTGFLGAVGLLIIRTQLKRKSNQ